MTSGNETVETRRRIKWPFWMIGITITVIAGVLLISKRSAMNPSEVESTSPPATHIKASSAKRGSIGVYIDALGNVTPVATISVYSQVTGRVTAVHFIEGQMVHRGDPLIDIDPVPYEAQLQQAQGALDRDTALLKQAEMDMARYEQASTVDAIARQTFDDQKLTVEQYRGVVKNDMGQLQYAQAQLGYCQIASPIDGRVGLRLVDPGNTIFSGGSNPIAVVTQLQPITVVFNVAEDNLGQVHDEITHRHGLVVDAYDRSQQQKLSTGRLLSLDNQVDSATGTVRFRAEFQNQDLSLFPNQFVNARMLVKTLNDVVLVPNGAVQHNGTQAFVYVVKAQHVELRRVTVIASEGDEVAVDGIRDGDAVAVTGFDKIQEGTAVVVETQEKAANQLSTKIGANL